MAREACGVVARGSMASGMPRKFRARHRWTGFPPRVANLSARSRPDAYGAPAADQRDAARPLPSRLLVLFVDHSGRRRCTLDRANAQMLPNRV